MSLSATFMMTLAQSTPPAGQPAPTDDQQWMVYAIIAFGMAIALLILETFVPSGGVLGVLAGMSAVGGIVMFFRFDTTWGMVSMAVTLLATPFLIGGLLWIWPHTPIGRALTLGDSDDDPDEPTTGANAGGDDASIAVGLEGVALTELRPVGACRLDGKRTDCIAQTGMIEPGTKVKVVFVDGLTVRVKGIE